MSLLQCTCTLKAMYREGEVAGPLHVCASVYLMSTLTSPIIIATYYSLSQSDCITHICYYLYSIVSTFMDALLLIVFTMRERVCVCVPGMLSQCVYVYLCVCWCVQVSSIVSCFSSGWFS